MTNRKISLYASLLSMFARMGGAIAATVIKKPQDQAKALEISDKVGQVLDVTGSVFDQSQQLQDQFREQSDRLRNSGFTDQQSK